jgi:hypothetical protein
MQSDSKEVDKTLNEEVFKLWQYQVKKVDADLVVRNAAGKAHVIQDDFKTPTYSCNRQRRASRSGIS